MLVRLTCGLLGLEQELPYFQKLQAAYNDKGLQPIAVFREKPEAAESYAVKKDLHSAGWPTPRATCGRPSTPRPCRPTSSSIRAAGSSRSCPAAPRTDAKVLSAEIARILQAGEAAVAEAKAKK